MPRADGCLALLLAGCLLSAACAGNPAPRGWLPSPAQAAEDPYGAWIEVLARDGSEIEGELIAVQDDSVFVLTSEGVLAALAYADAEQARSAFYRSEYGNLVLWAALGTVASISHGWFAAGTVPLWIIIGSVAAGSDSRAPMETVRRDEQWSKIRMFARFPQGMPPSLDRSVLRPRPQPPPNGRSR